MVDVFAVAVGAEDGVIEALSGLATVVFGPVAVSALAVAVVVSPAAGEVAAGVEPAGLAAAAADAAALASTSALSFATSTWLPAGRTIAEIRINKTTPRNAKTPIKE